MAVTSPPSRLGSGRRLALGLAGFAAVLALAPLFLLAVVSSRSSRRGGCVAGAPSGGLEPGAGAEVGATEYGGPGDPSSGHVGASGADLDAHPDSYAELGGTTFATATALGGLAFETPLRITWRGRSLVAYKRDIGLGGGPVDGRARVIDLWWRLAGALGIPYADGRWSGAVQVERPPATGTGNLLGVSAVDAAPLDPGGGSPAGSGDCPPTGSTGAPVVAGPRARLLADGDAAAPAGAPAAVRAMIAAGNAIAGRPYVYGGGHGLPLSVLAPAYDCSSSVEHLLWGGGLLPADGGSDSGALESFGLPGPGRWVTIYASADHVFMYVAGLRWDTHDAAGPGDGSAGIGWHPLIREDAGFVVRHPAGL